MKILVTGAKGFIGQNLISELRNKGFNEIYEYDLDTDQHLLDEYTSDCNFVFHLAGVNRPTNDEDFMKGNYHFTNQILEMLSKHGNKAPFLLSSSIQASLANSYGESKKKSEDLVFTYGKINHIKVFVYRLPNVFGKWCRPNYNSAIATFCHNTAHHIPVKVNDPQVMMNLVYIDDVVASFINKIGSGGNLAYGEFEPIQPIYSIPLGSIYELIISFRNCRENLLIPDLGDDFIKKLYSTYLSYLPEGAFSYPLKMNIDHRGSFTEFFKTSDRGQISINIIKPGIVKGNHWHHTKTEKFLVVSGSGVIRFRKVGQNKVIEYFVTEEKLEVLEIPPGYVHNIENLGGKEMVTVIWANELLDKDNPDTYYLNV